MDQFRARVVLKQDAQSKADYENEMLEPGNKDFIKEAEKMQSEVKLDEINMQGLNLFGVQIGNAEQTDESNLPDLEVEET